MIRIASPIRPPARDRRHERDEQARDARRHEIHEVIEPCCRPAEGFVTGISVPDHRIRRVDRLVEHEARQAEQGKPEDGCHDAIGEILGRGLDRGPGNSRLVEAFRIAPHDHGDRAPRCFQPLRIAHPRDVPVQ
jgi:hypothetical protein